MITGIKFFVFFAAGLSLILLRYYLLFPEPSVIDSMAGKKIEIEGMVTNYPDRRDNYTFLAMKPPEEKKKILVSAPSYGRYRYGDKIKIKGKLEEPENFVVSSGKEFDYKSYLAKDDIYFLMPYPEIELISRDNGSALKTVLYKTKEKFVESLDLMMPEPQSSLAAGLLVGGKRGLGKNLEESFRRAGLIHIVVLSGYNITIIAETVLRSFSFIYFLPRLSVYFLGAFSVILFVIMTGGEAAAVRALIMALLALYARATGRIYNAARALAASAFLMLLVNPRLFFDAGFQLSFLATAGLIFLSPYFDKRLLFLAKWPRLKETISSVLAAQTAVFPWLMYKTGEMSLVAFPSNILVLPFIPVTMLLSFITGVLGLISNYLAAAPAFLSYLALSYHIAVAQIFSYLPMASVIVPF